MESVTDIGHGTGIGPEIHLVSNYPERNMVDLGDPLDFQNPPC